MRAFAQLATSICTTRAAIAQLALGRRSGSTLRVAAGGPEPAAECEPKCFIGRLSLALFLTATLSLGCSSEPPEPKTPAAPADEWASLPKSAEWLHAAGDFSGPHK